MIEKCIVRCNLKVKIESECYINVQRALYKVVVVSINLNDALVAKLYIAQIYMQNPGCKTEG